MKDNSNNETESNSTPYAGGYLKSTLSVEDQLKFKDHKSLYPKNEKDKRQLNELYGKTADGSITKDGFHFTFTSITSTAKCSNSDISKILKLKLFKLSESRPKTHFEKRMEAKSNKIFNKKNKNKLPKHLEKIHNKTNKLTRKY